MHADEFILQKKVRPVQSASDYVSALCLLSSVFCLDTSAEKQYYYLTDWLKLGFILPIGARF